jgi:DHA2 family multidrug resistance protein
MNYTAEWAGIAVCFLGIAPIFFSQLTPKMMNFLGNLPTLLGAFLIFGIACFYTAFFNTAVDFAHVSFSRFLFGFGFIFYIAPLQSICVAEIPKEDLANATGLFHFFRAIMSGVGTSVFTTLWQRRTIFHHHQIGEVLTRFNPITPSLLDSKEKALLNRALDQQAAMLAINDVFWLMGWLFFLLLLLMGGYFLYSRKKQTDISIVTETKT